MKIALVYDRVNKWGGAERVLLALHEIWPKAPLYTAVYDHQRASWAKIFKVIPSFLNKLPLARPRHEIFPFLMPLAFESFDFREYDLVISITSEAAKGVITKPGTFHLCYCLTPTRYLWSGYQEYFRNRVQRLASRPVISYLRQWDRIAAQRPDFYLAISENVQKRIKQYYKRDSVVLYPPVDTKKWRVENPKKRVSFGMGEWKRENYFLIVSRLVKYKKVDLVIRAFNHLGWPLRIIGIGNQMSRLKRLAKKNVEFLGQLTDKELLGYYQKCQAVLFPQEEDFGLVPLEAQACGRPVIAYRAGGAQETIIEGKTGLFFDSQKTAALVQALRRFRLGDFKTTDCRRNAAKFSKKKFQKKFKAVVKKELRKWTKK